ncbi:hypothetical protein [Sphingobacterium paludis]|uniref:hypothetical protein n=1 Tax=Sphingobacterium paludis TaxID=1476465 RepID=UPI0010612124|nr:hypothetical protein [Sphingobacterium paludis]
MYLFIHGLTRCLLLGLWLFGASANCKYWLSCGSWYNNSALYTFRYQHGRFELIGFDHQEFHRAPGESSATSINFSIGKKSETSGGNMFGDEGNKPKTTWSTFKKASSTSWNTAMKILISS